MRALVAIFLTLIMALMASGFPQAAHEQMHRDEDAREDQAAARASHSGQPPSPAHHDHDDCPICQQFHAPFSSTSHTIRLIDTGTWVAFVSMLAVNQYDQTIPARISCRGPPAISC